MSTRRLLDPAFATTQDLMEAAGVQRRTIWEWVRRGLLPTPVMISQGRPGGVFNRFPASAVETARFIAAKRASGLSLDEVQELIEAEAREKGGPAPPTAVRSRGRARPSARSAQRRR